MSEKRLWLSPKLHASIGINKLRDIGIINVVFGYDGETGAHKRRYGLASEMCVGTHDTKITDLGRMLSDSHVVNHPPARSDQPDRLDMM